MKQKLNVNTKKTREYSTTTANHLLNTSRPFAQPYVQTRRKLVLLCSRTVSLAQSDTLKQHHTASMSLTGLNLTFFVINYPKTNTFFSTSQLFFLSASLVRTHNGGARNTSQNKILHVIEFVDPLQKHNIILLPRN